MKHIVTFFCMMGKHEILKLIFTSSCRDYIDEGQWKILVEAMLSEEKVKYSTARAIQEYRNYATTDLSGLPALFFEGFVKV